MDKPTEPSRPCPRCGKPLSADAPESLCASCLLISASETITQSVGDDGHTVSMDSGHREPHDALPRLNAGQEWGPYRIGRLLGSGGMGEVYEAEHTKSGRRVALKILRRQLRNGEDRARFLREGQLAASISHPHTVYIFGSEEISGNLAITMELLPGGTLKDRVTAKGPLPVTEAVAAILDIIGGLDAAQAAGILHRDIKPSNCFLDRDDSVKVGDFGLSISTLTRDVHGDLSTSGFQGTPQFAPPEQLRGEPLDVRADIYAVGATLYYLLTGKAPFDARTLRELFNHVLNDAPVNPKQIQGRIPQSLATLVLRCLSKNAADRPASYSELAESLRPFVATSDAPAKPGIRLLAGFIDMLIVGIPVAVVQVAFLNDPFMATTDTRPLELGSWLVSFVYFFLLEGFSGASLGKRLLGLRVLSLAGGPPTWVQILCRATVFQLPGMTTMVAVLAFGLPASVRPWASMVLMAALFATARRSNGWMAFHDTQSSTRVVSTSMAHARQLKGRVAGRTLEPLEGIAGSAVRFGPFSLKSQDPTDKEILFAFDPVLRRDVWIHRVPHETPPVSSSRRDLSRSTRLHWLTGRRSEEENWDAYEAPSGIPWSSHEAPPSHWPELKSWLLDLSNELEAAEKDGTLPRLSSDRLWLRDDGRIVLLDSASPFSDKSQEYPEVSPVGLLSLVAGGQGGVEAIPLSARTLFARWKAQGMQSLREARQAVLTVAQARDRVERWRRALPLVLLALPVLFLASLSLLLIPALMEFMRSPQLEVLPWLEVLNRQPPPGRLADPAIRAAFERYVAGRYASVIQNKEFWNSPVMRHSSMTQWRNLAVDIAARHPAVAEEEIEVLEAQLAPEIQRVAPARRSRPTGGRDQSLSVVTSTLIWIPMGAAAVLALISSLLVPGGIVNRSLGLALVDRRGGEASRLRSGVRSVIAWSPALIWFATLAAAPKIQGWVPAPASPLLGAGLCSAVLLFGAIWAVIYPTRSLQDRIAGTWIVPR